MQYRRSSVTMGRFIEVALLLVALGRVDGVSYLLANIDAVRAITAETGGFCLIDYPHLGKNVTWTVAPYSRNHLAIINPLVSVTVGVETKAFVIHVFGKDISIYGYNDNGFFTPLPVSALGSRYVVSTCLGSTDQVVLVIANYNQKTDVDITLMLDGNVTYDNMTYNDGDTIHVSLDEYQTFTLKSAYDLTGTVINTTRAVAVFSGAMRRKFLLGLAQLLPVRHHGTEYVLSTHGYSSFRDSTYQFQVVSDQIDAEIMLNNGSTFSLGDNRVYRQNLMFKEALHFNTTRPVIATVCRKARNINYHGFDVVTPVKYFLNNAQFYAFCTNVLTKQHVVDIEVFTDNMTPATLDLVDIPGSDYKAGTTCSYGRTFVHSIYRVALYGFYNDIINGGYHFPAEPSTTRAVTGSSTVMIQSSESPSASVSTNFPAASNSPVTGVSYLLTNIHTVVSAGGESGGFYLVDIPQLGYNVKTTVAPYSRGDTYIDTSVMVTVGVETKAVVIHVFGNDISISGYSGSSIFSPLPISALGSRYVVSTCLGYMDHVVLVIANYNQKTDVDITLMLDGNVTYDNMTYNDGHTIHVSLDEYQTFTLKSAYDLTGTVINTTRAVAVFSGSRQGRDVTAVAQLLPVRHHGTEFVLSTQDLSSPWDPAYQLQIVSEQFDAEIMLNNGSIFSLGDSRVYRQNLTYNETLYFNTTRPALATLCRFAASICYHGYVVVTPVEYFINNAQVSDAECINILTKQHVTDIEVFRSGMTPVTLDWMAIPGSDYKQRNNLFL
ncbi:uncharacterized protein LOC124264491 isoform X2 [Haliotis rubra]|uniref:uncharacterized protein LOC124264491 isoform X2 n=1 Tax=Haliotis rubra TaxID=36100 RepID=UPI001EE55982|nr:uncharacterized protein LOC124264491 isoform X2 [Haliotis rubra]